MKVYKEPSENSEGTTQQKPSAWLIALHLLGGGCLYSALKVSRIEVGGAIPAIIIVVIGYLGSKLIVSAIWKTNPSTTAKITIGVVLVFVYFVLSIALAMLIGRSGQVGSASLINNSRQVAQNQIVNRSEQALKLTVRDGDYHDVERELNNKKWSADELGMALHVAALKNKPRAAARLLTSGANSNYSVFDRNAVVTAATENNPEVLEVLLEHGADPNWKATFDWRPLHSAIKKNKSFDRVLLLLLKHGAAVDATTNLLITPLHRAAGFCRGSAVQILLQHGASKKLRDKYGQTAAQRAEKSGCSEIASLLKPS